MGAAMQWLRDGLGILTDVAESEAIATSVADSGGVWCVPAFQGLGTPYLDPAARAVIGGLSRATGRAEVVRAVLEGIAYRCGEVIDALRADAPTRTSRSCGSTAERLATISSCSVRPT